ncbi:metallophosphoesterase, partial [Corallococcus praedator]
LANSAVAFSLGDHRFWIAGLGDQMARLGPPITGVDDLPALTAQVPAGEPALLLAHEPDIFPEVGDRFAVTLSGHTHAGQIKIAGRTPVVPSRFGSRYVYGHVVEDGRHLIVSAGLGTSMVPIRLGTRPEIVELVLGSEATPPPKDD